MKIAVSFIKSKYNEKETIDIINQTSADFLHVDIMDGIFAGTKNYDLEDTLLFTKNNHLPLDIHLMVNNPKEYVEEFLKINPYNITFHIEAENNPINLIDYIHEHDVKCSLAINPETNIKEIIPYLDLIDNVLVMSVIPGKGGQRFIPETLEKIEAITKLKGNFTIEVDGGINNEIIKYLDKVDIIVSGSFICEGYDYEQQIQKLKII